MPSTPPHKDLGQLLKQAKAEAPAAPRRPADKTPPLVVRSVALTPAAQTTLEPLIAQALAATGRKASTLGVVRALLAWAIVRSPLLARGHVEPQVAAHEVKARHDILGLCHSR
jgi:hypothetical protein